MPFVVTGGNGQRMKDPSQTKPERIKNISQSMPEPARSPARRPVTFVCHDEASSCFIHKMMKEGAR
jgi:hypothetical protein